MQHPKHCLAAAIERRHTGLVCKILHQHFRHRFEQNAREKGLDDVTITHGRILGFLARGQGRDIFQKDIETEFRINRSTVTSIMQVMEKNGLIERRIVPRDNRLRQVLLTEKGIEMHQKTVSVIDQTERQMLAGFSETEITAFFETVQKIEKNLTGEDTSC